MPDDVVTLPDAAARVLARTLHLVLDAPGAGPAPIDALSRTGVCLDPDILGEADAAARLGELVAKARREGAACPMVRLGEKKGATALLVSGDHVWRLVDAVDELQTALEALATLLAGLISPEQAATLARHYKDTAEEPLAGSSEPGVSRSR